MTPIIILGLLAFLYFWYAGLIAKRNKAKEALSGIDVQLKQRLDLIPNILKIASKFMEHESELLTQITALRTQATSSYDKNNKDAVAEHLNIAKQLEGKMGQLMVNVENYPTLKSDQTMLQAMQTYNEVESMIAAARRFYNSAVTALNNSVEVFPGNIIANMAGVQTMPFFEAEAEARASIDANQYLK